MTIPRALYAGMTLVWLAVSTAAAEEIHLPDNEALRHIRSLSAPRLSPDGKRVLIALSDSTADGAASHLWLVDIGSNQSRQLTVSPETDKGGEKMGQWTADGAAVLFLAKRGENTRLYRLPMAGGEAKPYDLKVVPPVDLSRADGALPPRQDDQPAAKPAPLPIDVESYAVSPDAVTIAVLAKDPETPGEKKQHEEKADAVMVDHDPHGVRLYLLNARSAALEPVDVPPNVQEVAWNPAGNRLIAITEAANGQADLAPARTAWIVDADAPSHPMRLDTAPASIAEGTWSEDGKLFYFVAQAEQDAPPGYRDLYAMTLADGKIRSLSPGLAGTVVAKAPIASAGGVMQLVQLGTRQQVMRFVDGKAETAIADAPLMRDVGTNQRRTGWVWLAAGPTQPDQLRFVERPGQTPRTLPLPAMIPDPWDKVPSRLVHWQNDGLTIEGLLTLPPQAAAGRVPLVLMVHGGPTGVWQDRFDPLVYYFLAQGWAVLRPNPRGSTGYGVAFAAANKNDLGGGDFRDLMTGVDTVIANFPIDPARLAYYGYSYGGEMAGFAEGKTDRFKAIVSGAPVIDQYSEYGTEAGSYYDRWFYGRPWDHPEEAWRQSPLAYVGHARTPFLLLQGEADTVDPLGQSQEMYRALRQMGVPVEMVRYPRDDHGPLSQAIQGNAVPETWHGFDARRRIVAFINAAFAQAQ